MPTFNHNLASTPQENMELYKITWNGQNIFPGISKESGLPYYFVLFLLSMGSWVTRSLRWEGLEGEQGLIKWECLDLSIFKVLS